MFRELYEQAWARFGPGYDGVTHAAEESACHHPDLQITTDRELVTLPAREQLSWTLSEVAAAVDVWAGRLRAAGV